MRLNRLIIYGALLLLGSCVEPFIPDTANYQDVYFIECHVTQDESVPAWLKISKAAPIVTQAGDRLTNQPEPVSGAVAFISESDGKTFNFQETGKGLYHIPGGYNPPPGTSCKLTVAIGNDLFESDYEVMPHPVPVTGITSRAIVRKVYEDSDPVDGIGFYVSNSNPAPGPAYYRYDLEATYKFTVPYEATHYWDGRTQIPTTNREIRTCWKTESIPGIYITSTEGLTANNIVDAPINFQSQYGDELTIRYSLHVTQYTLGPTAYEFWKNINKLVNQSGGLYETLPFRVEGNIHSTKNTTTIVTGLFEVAAVTTERTFVNKPTEFKIIPFECILSQVGTRSFPWYILPAGSFLVQYSNGAFYASTPACFDCREREGTLEKPAFWKD
jgi:hypothetical protein